MQSVLKFFKNNLISKIQHACGIMPQIQIECECQICYETIITQDQIITLNCGHVFCKLCLQQQYKHFVNNVKNADEHLTCAMCRAVISDEYLKTIDSEQYDRHKQKLNNPISMTDREAVLEILRILDNYNTIRHTEGTVEETRHSEVMLTPMTISRIISRQFMSNADTPNFNCDLVQVYAFNGGSYFDNGFNSV